jgi:hypothetical protein
MPTSGLRLARRAMVLRPDHIDGPALARMRETVAR